MRGGVRGPPPSPGRVRGRPLPPTPLPIFAHGVIHDSVPSPPEFAGNYEQAAADAQRLDLPDLFWTHAKAATAYGHLGRSEEARSAVDKLLELYPDFGEKARDELESIYWPNPEYIDRYIDGLRRAGLDIPALRDN